MSIKALSPEGLRTAIEQGEHIPDEIIGVINQLLIDSGSNSPTLRLKDVKKAIQEKIGSANFPKQWLDFEPVFRAQGWNVVYDQPAYDENYEPFYRFSSRP